MTTKIFIADDHGVLRAGLRAILEDDPNFEVVGEAPDGETTLSLLRKIQADIVLMQLRLPRRGGIETTRQLKTQFPDTQVLFLAVDEDANVLRDAVKAGASGYMIMRAAGEELIQALHTVSRRELYIHPAMTRRLLQDFTITADPNPSAIHQLTRREVEVLHYIVRGYTSRQIADTLFLSDRTVIGYRSSLMDKLKVKNRVELVELAQKHGLF